jgi:hypothetical protein
VKWLNTADCKSALSEFGGSNPSSSTINFETLAQLVEHLTFNQGVVGSNPTCLIHTRKETCRGFFFAFRIGLLAKLVDIIVYTHFLFDRFHFLFHRAWFVPPIINLN